MMEVRTRHGKGFSGSRTIRDSLRGLFCFATRRIMVNASPSPRLSRGPGGEMIVCIDSDSFVERDAIKLLVQPLEDSSVAAVCGHGEAANRDEGFLPKLQHYWYAEMFRLVKGMESRLGVVGCCSGMLAAYRRSAILPLVNQWLSEKDGASARLVESGRSDASWLGRGLTGRLIKSPGEDRILTAFALSGENARVVYQSNAIVYTIVPRTLRQFVKQQLRWNRAWIHGSILAGRFMRRKSALASFSHTS